MSLFVDGWRATAGGVLVPQQASGGVPRPASRGQLALPTCGRATGPGEARFAHPAEAEFARLLTWHRVRWVYEPTSFAIEWDAQGLPFRFFTPDFYLPDQRLYLELTTMRQPLVTRKNRKLRLVRELYPNLRIKLLYRRDVLRLREQHAASCRQVGHADLAGVVASEREIAGGVRLLAERIADEWLSGPARVDGMPVLVAAGKGAIRFKHALLAEFARLGFSCPRNRVHRSRFDLETATGGIRLVRGSGAPLAGRRVLVVEDVVSTGLAASVLADWLGRQGIAEWRSCALLDRRPARLLDVPLDWVAFEAPDMPLAGYGLAMHPRLRAEPHIHAVAPTAS